MLAATAQLAFLLWLTLCKEGSITQGLKFANLRNAGQDDRHRAIKTNRRSIESNRTSGKRNTKPQ